MSYTTTYEVRVYDRRGTCLQIEGFTTLKAVEAWIKGPAQAKAECAKVIDNRTYTERAHWHRTEKGWARA